ncbi:MAG: hypothetical protein IID44_13505 [Planctomycetes bacterium]|nr:hypothetical protein [Planctomycetota bacterium]
MAIFVGVTVRADEVRYYEENGVTYRETRRMEKRPVSETRYEDRERTVYRPRLVHETRRSYRTYHTPVTEYVMQPYWIGRWNPFVQPVQAWRQVARTHWEVRSEPVDVSVTRQEWVAEKQTYRVPVTTMRTEQREIITRVAVSGSGVDASRVASKRTTPSIARRERIGGLHRLDAAPRRGGADAWQAGGGIIRR